MTIFVDCSNSFQEFFERAQQLRGVLEQYNIPIPDPPPKQRAPPADVPRAVIPVCVCVCVCVHVRVRVCAYVCV